MPIIKVRYGREYKGRTAVCGVGGTVQGELIKIVIYDWQYIRNA
jgi:hypothetical protein